MPGEPFRNVRKPVQWQLMGPAAAVPTLCVPKFTGNKVKKLILFAKRVSIRFSRNRWSLQGTHKAAFYERQR